ncbi:MAG: hypothetical protein QT11_C0001G0761 [archaeon GW2011_AR20]|nr:MAG: hypothetical protein QT11_C0001G0761 [archaeon GW2011_AR20]MBS3160826.1 hypothetical protein [Candidatus Woesearchaeota archaeon]
MIEYRFQGDKVSQIQKIINEYDDIEKTTDMKMHRKKLVGYKLDDNILIHIYHGFGAEDLTEVQLHTLNGDLNGEKDIVRKLESLKPLSD